MNRRKRKFDIKENLQTKNIMIRYINAENWSTENKIRTLKAIEDDFYMRGLYNLYAHIEIVICDRDEIEIKQIYVRKKR